MKVYLGEPDEKNLLDNALAVSPGWDNMYISRHKNGWVFVNAHGVRFALDDGKHGWIPVDAFEAVQIYQLLGKKEVEIYYEKE